MESSFAPLMGLNTTAMSPVAQNKDLVRRYVEEVINTGDVRHIEHFISPDYVEIYRDQEHAVGIAGAKEHVLGVRLVYPDLHLTVHQQIAEGEWVVTVYTARGTHQGEWMGIQPTGKVIEVTGVNVDRVKNGLIVQHGGAANLLEPLLEVGALKVVGEDDSANTG